jgi:hypothetical protein
MFLREEIHRPGRRSGHMSKMEERFRWIEACAIAIVAFIILIAYLISRFRS